MNVERTFASAARVADAASSTLKTKIAGTSSVLTAVRILPTQSNAPLVLHFDRHWSDRVTKDKEMQCTLDAQAHNSNSGSQENQWAGGWWWLFIQHCPPLRNQQVRV